MKLPAEPEDWMKRPAYIRENNAGANICENRCVCLSCPTPMFFILAIVDRAKILPNLRVQYLVLKGAILRKGQRIKTKFCKFSASPQGEMHHFSNQTPETYSTAMNHLQGVSSPSLLNLDLGSGLISVWLEALSFLAIMTTFGIYH